MDRRWTLHAQGEPTRLRDRAPLRQACRARARSNRAACAPTPRFRRAARRRSRRPDSGPSSRRTKIGGSDTGVASGVLGAVVGRGSSVRVGWHLTKGRRRSAECHRRRRRPPARGTPPPARAAGTAQTRAVPGADHADHAVASPPQRSRSPASDRSPVRRSARAQRRCARSNASKLDRSVMVEVLAQSSDEPGEPGAHARCGQPGDQHRSPRRSDPPGSASRAARGRQVRAGPARRRGRVDPLDVTVSCPGSSSRAAERSRARDGGAGREGAGAPRWPRWRSATPEGARGRERWAVVAKP